MYKLIKNPKEGELIQYLGVYVTKWQSHMGTPQVAFVENDYGLSDAIDDLFSVQLVDNTRVEALGSREEIIKILKKLVGEL